MAVSVQAIWVLLITGTGLLSAFAGRALATRVDPLATLAACGLAELACLSVATIYASGAW